MNSVSFTSNPKWVAKLCLHCGASVPNAEVSEFCCQGCAAVYSLLHERGLEDFYVLRDRAKNGGEHFAASFSDEKFLYLDDPEFIAQYAFENHRQMRFYLEGVHCVACLWLTEKLPEFVPGVEFLRLNLSSNVATLRLKPHGKFSEAACELLRLGYRPHPVVVGESEMLQKKENQKHLIRIGIAGMASGNIMLLAVALYAGATGSLAEIFKWTSFLLFIPILFYCSIPFYKGAWSSLRKKQISIDVPIVFGLFMGTGLSFVNLLRGSNDIYFDSLSTLNFLLLSTRFLLRKVNQQALNLSQLMHFLAPSRGRRRLSDQTYEEVKSDALREGDLVQVLPGECFPADGVIVDGESRINCALLTGESHLLAVKKGSRVHAGTWNQDAPLELRVLTAGPGTRLGKILSSVEEGLTRKAPIVSFLDRVGQAFVVAVFVLSGVGFLVGLNTSWNEAFSRALAISIIVCPCTFALATPLAMSLAIGRAAKRGILVKSAELIERLSHVKTVFFDKTGTLTEGQLQIMDWKELLPNATQALIALESRSVHPIAKAVVRHFRTHLGLNTPIQQVEEFLEKPGVGVSGRIGKNFYQIRSAIEFTTSTAGEETKNENETETETQIVLWQDDQRAGVLTLADRVRSDSKKAIDDLRTLGLDIYLLSGDLAGPVHRVASYLGIPLQNVVAQASPERKSEILKRNPKSLMVGEGANDAIALASAYASVAVQGGMEMSIRAAGAYSSKPGVNPIPSLIMISQETMNVIRKNLFFAVVYNIFGIAAALSGYLSPLFAAVLMPMSALTVFLSTMIGTSRLRKGWI